MVILDSGLIFGPPSMYACVFTVFRCQCHSPVTRQNRKSGWLSVLEATRRKERHDHEDWWRHQTDLTTSQPASSLRNLSTPSGQNRPEHPVAFLPSSNRSYTLQLRSGAFRDNHTSTYGETAALARRPPIRGPVWTSGLGRFVPHSCVCGRGAGLSNLDQTRD